MHTAACEMEAVYSIIYTPCSCVSGVCLHRLVVLLVLFVYSLNLCFTPRGNSYLNPAILTQKWVITSCVCCVPFHPCTWRNELITMCWRISLSIIASLALSLTYPLSMKRTGQSRQHAVRYTVCQHN